MCTSIYIMQRPNNVVNDDCQLVMVQQNLRSLPSEIIEKYADHVNHVDLSYNCLKDLSWLPEFERLHHLVLDNNRMDEAQLRTLKQPLHQLEVLMLNKNEFSDLPTTIQLIRRLFPNLQYLSLHGNPICPDGLELQPFSSYLQYDYAYYSNYIAHSLKRLKFLDHGVVQRTYRYESFPIKNYNPGGGQQIKTTSF